MEHHRSNSQQAGPSYTRNSAHPQMPYTNSMNRQVNPTTAIQLMTVSRPNTNNYVNTKVASKPTMQFHGINSIDPRIRSSSNATQSTEAGINRFNVPNENERRRDVPLRELTPQENVRFLLGTIEKVMKWHRTMKGFCHFEVIGPVVSIQEGTMRFQKILLLRDKKGPVLKVIHYMCDRIDLPNFHIGQYLRCVGRMTCPGTLQAIVIREARDQEIAALPRFSALSDQAIAMHQRDNINKPPFI